MFGVDEVEKSTFFKLKNDTLKFKDDIPYTDTFFHVD